VLVLALAALLSVEGEEEVVVPIVNVPLPGSCTFRRVTGYPCPGCGLTRCFVSLAHGDVGRAWHFQPAGLLIFVVAVSQIPYRTVQIWRIHRGNEELRCARLGHAVAWLMLAAILGQWFVRLCMGML